MLATRRSAGVALDVNLIVQTMTHASNRSTLALKPLADVTGSPTHVCFIPVFTYA